VAVQLESLILLPIAIKEAKLNWAAPKHIPIPMNFQMAFLVIILLITLRTGPLFTSNTVLEQVTKDTENHLSNIKMLISISGDTIQPQACSVIWSTSTALIMFRKLLSQDNQQEVSLLMYGLSTSLNLLRN